MKGTPWFVACSLFVAGSMALTNCGESSSNPPTPLPSPVVVASPTPAPSPSAAPLPSPVPSPTPARAHAGPHTATAPGGFNTGLISPGGQASVVMQSAGNFNYNCSVHPTMVGSFSVSP